MAQLLGRFVPVKVDADTKAAAKLLEKYKVEALPTILVLDSNGKVLHSFMGFRDPAAFIKEIQKFAKKK